MKTKNNKIAILFSDSSLETRRGIMNAVLARVEHLKPIVDYQIDVFCLVPRPSFFASLAQRRRRKRFPNEKYVDGIKINVIPYTFSVLGYILKEKLRLVDFINEIEIRFLSKKLKGYDLIVSHSTLPASLALNAYKRFGVPFSVTWHGSDIHTSPWLNRYEFKKTKDIIKSSAVNIFVSEALRLKSEEIERTGEKVVLYNAASESFCRLYGTTITEYRKKYNVEKNQKIILYAGNFYSVKNADLLPEIFDSIQNKFKERIKFLIAGDGDLRSTIETKLSKLNIDCDLLGNIPSAEMPLLMNIADMLVLPSKNEGLPLVVVEAAKCGCQVVGSDVGGISEVIGKERVVPLGENFIEDFSNKVVEFLSSSGNEMIIPSEFVWDMTALKEKELYMTLLKESNI